GAALRNPFIERGVGTARNRQQHAGAGQQLLRHGKTQATRGAGEDYELHGSLSRYGAHGRLRTYPGFQIPSRPSAHDSSASARLSFVRKGWGVPEPGSTPSGCCGRGSALVRCSTAPAASIRDGVPECLVASLLPRSLYLRLIRQVGSPSAIIRRRIPSTE